VGQHEEGNISADTAHRVECHEPSSSDLEGPNVKRNIFTDW